MIHIERTLDGFIEESPPSPIIMPGVNGDFVSNKQTGPSIRNVLGFAKIEPSGGFSLRIFSMGILFRKHIHPVFRRIRIDSPHSFGREPGRALLRHRLLLIPRPPRCLDFVIVS